MSPVDVGCVSKPRRESRRARPSDAQVATDSPMHAAAGDAAGFIHPTGKWNAAGHGDDGTEVSLLVLLLVSPDGTVSGAVDEDGDGAFDNGEADSLLRGQYDAATGHLDIEQVHADGRGERRTRWTAQYLSVGDCISGGAWTGACQGSFVASRAVAGATTTSSTAEFSSADRDGQGSSPRNNPEAKTVATAPAFDTGERAMLLARARARAAEHAQQQQVTASAATTASVDDSTCDRTSNSWMATPEPEPESHKPTQTAVMSLSASAGAFPDNP